MLSSFYESISKTSNVSVIIISISLMLFLGFLMTRITKILKLPNVTAYILTGILIGPFCLNLIPNYVIKGMDFITDISLAFVAFSVGEFFKIDALKKNGLKVVLITLFESLTASLLIFILIYNILHLNLAFSIVLAALASATAPASTIMTIRQTKAKGDYVDTLLQVVALDDVVSLIAYSISISIAVATMSNNFNSSTLFQPITINLLVIMISIIFGFILKLLMSEKRTKDNRLIVSIALLFAFCGICAALEVSPLLGCMVIGMVYINISNDNKLFKQLNYFSPPILLLFFVTSGINFDISSLFTKTTFGNISLLMISLLYFITRIFGKYLGSYIGCKIAKKDDKTCQYLGLGLIPQAGVAIGLAFLGSRTLGGEMGDTLQTIILASSVMYELVGPACAKLGLFLTKSYTNNLDDIKVEVVNEDGTQKNNVDILIEKIKKIQSDLPKKEIERNNIDLDEQAYNEAIERYEENLGYRYNRMRRR